MSYILCYKENCFRFKPDLSNMLEFLYTLLNLSYSSLNTARSALSCLVLIDKIPVGRHPVVCCFLKGAFEQKPPAHNYYGIWDANQVLQFLKAFSPNRCYLQVSYAFGFGNHPEKTSTIAI